MKGSDIIKVFSVLNDNTFITRGRIIDQTGLNWSKINDSLDYLIHYNFVERKSNDGETWYRIVRISIPEMINA